MEKVTRTKASIRNSIYALIFLVVSTLLNFYSRKIFIDNLGIEILGLNTTAVNILQFFNLAELGIGMAVGFSLYKPLSKDDYLTINEIVTLQGLLYRKIAIWIIVIVAIIMSFFPIFFRKMELPLWYAYASFSVMLFSSLLGYFVNYRQIVLASAQLDYKIQLSFRTWTIIKVCFQMIAVSNLSNPYIWWLSLEVFFTIIASISLTRMTNKTFPFLKKTEHSFAELKNKYPIIISKIKQLFIHRLAGYALNQTSPIIIYAYLSLSVVTLYGNYMIIINGIQSVCNAVFNSMGAGVGNLVAEGNKDKILKVFEELFSIRFLIGSCLTFAFIMISQPFLDLWIGNKYQLQMLTIYIMAVSMFVFITRNTVDIYINAYGLFKDIWAPATEATLNIGLSVLLGAKWGLNGILIGSLISQIIIVLGWKPYFLFKAGFQKQFRYYILIYMKHLSICIITFVICLLLFRITQINTIYNNTWLSLIIYSAVTVSIFLLILTIFMFISNCGIRLFYHRIKSHLINKKLK